MNVFYNIVSILIGIIILVFSIITYVKKKKLLFLILSVIHSVLFVGFGILGFILMGTDYEYITILSMLAFCITYLIVLLVLYKKEPKENKDNK